jgi:hypothetical protein
VTAWMSGRAEDDKRVKGSGVAGGGQGWCCSAEGWDEDLKLAADYSRRKLNTRDRCP